MYKKIKELKAGDTVYLLNYKGTPLTVKSITKKETLAKMVLIFNDHDSDKEVKAYGHISSNYISAYLRDCNGFIFYPVVTDYEIVKEHLYNIKIRDMNSEIAYSLKTFIDAITKYADSRKGRF